jgi:hypothetical protein
MLSLVAAAVITFGIAITLNCVVDPFGVLPESFPGKSALIRRPCLSSNEYLHKAYAMKHGLPRTLFLGSSRVCVGLPATHPSLEPPVYNGGLTAAGPREILAYLRHAVELGSVREVFIGLDRWCLVGARKSPASFDPDILLSAERRQMPQWWTSPAILSLNTTWKSLLTLAGQAGPSMIYPQGVREGGVMRERIGGRSWRASVSLLSKRNADGEGGGASPGDETGYGMLVEMIRLCRSHGIRLHLFTNPINGIELEETLATGGWCALVEWKRLILRAIDEAAPGEDGGFWDFATFHSAAYELAETPSAEGEWSLWWELSHYKAELGDHMLSVMKGVKQDALVAYVRRCDLDRITTQQYEARNLFSNQRARMQAALESLKSGNRKSVGGENRVGSASSDRAGGEFCPSNVQGGTIAFRGASAGVSGQTR